VVPRQTRINHADAREEAKEVLRREAKGEDPAMEKKWQRKAETFRELAELYLEHHAKATKESSGNNRTIWTAGLPARMRPGRPRSHGWRPPVHKDLIPRFGSRKAGEIARRDMLDMLKAIKARGAPIQANRTLEIARKPFNWAIGEELVAHNPCDHIGKLSPENQRSRVLSPAEIRTLWAALDTRSPLVAAAHRLMLATGQLLATTKPGLNKSTVRHV
jgi:integrase